MTPGSAPPLDEMIKRVQAERPRLIDRWEAAALIESFGYTDARVQREFGMADTLTLGSHVYEALVDRAVHSNAASGEIEPAHPLRDLLHCMGASLVYAMPWMVALAVNRRDPPLLALPGGTGQALTIAVLLSIVVSGGFIQALTRLGRFYLDLRQPRVAAAVCGSLFKIGVSGVVLFAAAAIAAGSFAGTPSPNLILFSDHLVLFSVVWMLCGILTLRRQYWRVALAFAAGAVAFGVVRAAGGDALLGELIGAATILVVALSQVRSVFGARGAAAVAVPRLGVLLHRVLPFFCYGTLYFGFLCADRLTSLALRLTPSQEAMLGMDLALLTFLCAAWAVEYANLRFSHSLQKLLAVRFEDGGAALGRALGGRHRQVVALATAGVAVMMLIAWQGGRRVLGIESPGVWATVVVADVGYLLFSVGILNGLVLMTLNQPWTAAASLAGGVIVNVTVTTALAHTLPYSPVAGLAAGALCVAVLSTGAVYGRLRRPGYALATF